MQTIVVTLKKQGNQDTYRACLEDDPGFYGSGVNHVAAAGDLVRRNFSELGLEDEDLQVELGVHWDNLSDYEIGQLIQQRALFNVQFKDSQFALQ